MRGDGGEGRARKTMKIFGRKRVAERDKEQSVSSGKRVAERESCQERIVFCRVSCRFQFM